MLRTLTVATLATLLVTSCASAAMSSSDLSSPRLSNPSPTATAWNPGPGFSQPDSATSTGQQTCRSYHLHAYEVCFAYVVNNTYLARLPYYKFGHSHNGVIANLALKRLQSRFIGPELAMIVRQTSSWPAPEQIQVFLPSITIIPPVRVAPNESSAVLHTRETWLVRTTSGRILFSANHTDFRVVERRVVAISIGPQPILHKWAVYQTSPWTR